MNLPNIISFSRIPILFFITILLYTDCFGSSTIAFLLFLLAGFSDFLDGYIARKYNNISNIGKILDALIDKIFIIGLMITLLTLEIIPTWTLFLILLILVREFLITGLRLLASNQNIILSAKKTGKIKTCVQFMSIGVIFLNHVFISDYNKNINNKFIQIIFLIGIILFFIATILTLKSGISYFKKYKKIFLNN